MIFNLLVKQTSTLWGELLLGEGFWLGIIIIEALIFIVSSIVKEFKWIGSGICIMIGLYFLDNLAVNSNYMWGMVIMVITPFFLFLMD